MISLDFSSGDSILQMSNSNPGPGMPGNQGTPGSSGSPNNLGGNPGGFPGGPEIIHTHNTNVQIIHDDGSWSNTIRSLFIYSTGGLRFWANLSRGGSPTQRIFIIGTTVLGYQLSRVLQNTVNDPTYVLRHSRNWNLVLRSEDSASVQVDPSTDQSFQNAESSRRVPESKPESGVGSEGSSGSGNVGGSGNVIEPSGASGSGETGEIAKNMIGGDIDLGEIFETILKKIAGYLDFIFEPVLVSFSNDVLANQIHNISIILFFLTICIIIFFISLLVNITVFIFSDRLMKYFTNKYIQWYLSFNKKVIGLEIFMLSGWIIYLFYMLLYGLHYIATHPIII